MTSRSLVPALFACALVFAGPALAESPPPGSYQNSCVNPQVQKLLGGAAKNLIASCQKQNGKYVPAILPLPCAGDIMNKNGELVCKANKPNPYTPPPGSYMQSCKNAEMMGPILKAYCKDQNGNRVETTINVLDCKGRDISVNKNGKLVCR